MGDGRRPLEGGQHILKRKQDWSQSWCRLKKGDLGPAKAFRGAGASWLLLIRSRLLVHWWREVEVNVEQGEEYKGTQLQRLTERALQSLSLSHTHTYVLVAHVPVGSLSVGHDLPHHNAKAPDVRGWGEAVVLDGLWGGPQHHTLPSVLTGAMGGRWVESVPKPHCNILFEKLLNTLSGDGDSLVESFHLEQNLEICRNITEWKCSSDSRIISSATQNMCSTPTLRAKYCFESKIYIRLFD